MQNHNTKSIFTFVLRRSHALSNLLRRSRFMRSTAILSLFLLVLATSAILVPIYNNISVTEAATGTAQSSTLTLDVSNNTASVDLSVDNSNGTFVSSDSSSSISFNVSTNNYTGYKLSLSGNDNSQRLTHSSNSSYYLSSITGSVGESDFSANNATAASNYNGKWGYNLTINSGTPSDYLAAPTTTSTPLDETSSANVSGSSNNYKIGIGARASYSQPSGTYTGTYILTVVPNAINYVITYEDPTDEATNIPLEASDSTSQTTITLDSTIPTRNGYTFIGWCLGNITITNSNVDTCTGITYQPGASFGVDQTTENKPTLLAMWEKDIQTIASFTYMQDMTPEACSNTTIGATTTIKDSRDNTEYTIGKLADGNCWLLDNLALDLVANKSKLSSSNTNATDTQLSYLINGGGATSDQYATSRVINWPSGTTNNYSYSVPYQQISYKDTTGTGGYAAGKYGVYYNYCAASAGTYCYGNRYSIAGSPSGDATADICPKGWRMPTGGDSSEYKTLYNKYNTYGTFVAALHTPLSGNYNDGAATNQGGYGIFWASNYGDTSNMRGLRVTTSIIDATNGYIRYSGYHVRCIFKNLVASGMYMQGITSVTVANMESEVEYTMLDKRDDNDYTVKKINGRLWMTQNMRIVGGTVLTSESSNVSSNYTLPASSTSGFNDYTTANLYCSTSVSTGCWYNYRAATAGTIYGSANTTEASYSICPFGWKLPSDIEFRAIADNTYVSTFNPVIGGLYSNGSLSSTNVGYWWSSTAYSAVKSSREHLFYNSVGGTMSRSYGGRSDGYFVRCIFNG